MAGRYCHGHCHVKSWLIGGEGLRGCSGTGGGLGHPAALASLAPRWHGGDQCIPPCWGVGGTSLLAPRGSGHEQSRLVSWTGLGRHPPPPHFTLFLLPGPHPNRKNGPGARRGACGDFVRLHCRSQPSLQTDKPSTSPHVNPDGAGGDGPTERCLYRGEEGSKKARLLLPAARPRLSQAVPFCIFSKLLSPAI